MMLQNGELSETARRAIAGMMSLAPAITAFGNKNPTSYFRLVPHQEAPTNVCWGDRNRSVLVRVPLGWTASKDMCTQVNPLEKKSFADSTMKQTVEMRSPDCSADIYQLMAALCVACRHGLEMPAEEALRIAAETYVDVDIHKPENAEKLKRLAQLPACCVESAKALQACREVFEAHGVFSARLIDGVVKSLTRFDDKELIAKAMADEDYLEALVAQYFHCG